MGMGKDALVKKISWCTPGAVCILATPLVDGHAVFRLGMGKDHVGIVGIVTLVPPGEHALDEFSILNKLRT